MIEFSIHIPSVAIGFFLGYAVIAAVFLFVFYNSKWDAGFFEGWNCGKEYGERKKREEMEGEQNEEN